ncbi:hypothetical protein B9G55_18835 [Saccharibacillus sp. O16]|nr:hypothetical protein B9G55_18835 [Saccharibacillus sp. O16]
MMSSAMRGHTKQMASGLGGVLGTMTSSGVKLDDFKHEIRDYLIAELSGTLENEQEDGGMILGDTLPPTAVSTPVQEPGNSGIPMSAGGLTRLRVNGLKAGDRVLAIRVNGGNDIVILCKVVGADG